MNKMPPERLAIPKKGRVFEPVQNLLRESGFKLRAQERLDFCLCAALGIEVYYLPAHDIPLAVASGAIGYGITGMDLIEESGARLEQHMELGLGRTRMVLATPEEHPWRGPKSLEGKRIGTSFPHITRKRLRKLGVRDFETVSFAGSVEIQVRLGIVDAIVEISETGTTLRANRLATRATLLESELVLCSAPGRRGPALKLLVKRFGRVLRGRSHVLLKFNLPRKLLGKACSLSHGMSSPTVNELADPNWLALEVAVHREELHSLMDRLADLGAKGILSCDLTLCAPDGEG